MERADWHAPYADLHFLHQNRTISTRNDRPSNHLEGGTLVHRQTRAPATQKTLLNL